MKSKIFQVKIFNEIQMAELEKKVNYFIIDKEVISINYTDDNTIVVLYTLENET